MSQQPSDGSPNWLGLLQWSLAHQDGTAPTNVDMITEENREWLEGVLREGVIDEPKRIGDVVLSVKIKLESDSLTPIDVDELEEITDITEQIDMAGVFVKLSGFKLAYMLVTSYGQKSSVSDSILGATLNLVGTVCQNNPIVQEQAFNTFPGYVQSLYGAIVALLLRVEGACLSPALQSKALFALSTIVRGHPRAEGIFVTTHYQPIANKILCSNGYSADPLSVPVKSASYNVIGKTFFLSSALLSSEHCTAERVERIAAVLLPVCAKAIAETDVNIRDGAVSVVNELLKSEQGQTSVARVQSALCESVLAVNVRLRKELNEATAEDTREFIAQDIAVLEGLYSLLTGRDQRVERALAAKEDSGEVLLIGP